MLRISFRVVAATLLVCGFSVVAEAQAPSVTTFEAGPVRPMAMSPNGNRLFVVNRPDSHLEIFDITSGTPVNIASVPVGLEPVAVAARNNNEVWVVNHLSDSISIVNVGSSPPRVTRTLLVGDEPRDIVFAGPGGNRAFITTAHRGQNSPYPTGDYDVEGIGRADVWVFDATNLTNSLGGTPLTIITMFADKPRALATFGGFVYAAAFHSGNQTMTVGEAFVCNNNNGTCSVQGTTYPGGMPPPFDNFQGITAPETGLIVKFHQPSGQWRDELNRNWNPAVKFSLPDLDVFEIDANAATPAVTRTVAGVGTILFNMIVNPVTQKLYVTNTEANNRVRFEGPGNHAANFKPAGEPATVRGHLHEARITVIDNATNVFPRHLNKHIDYDQVPVPAGVKERSIATPMGMALTADGSTLYVAGFGSRKIAKFDTTELENDTFVPDAADHIPVNQNLPTAIVLDEPRNRMYVTSHYTNQLLYYNLATEALLGGANMNSREPVHVALGRVFLYAADFTSSNGESSCGSCHVFGDFDGLAWDLGNPDDVVAPNPNPGVGGGVPFGGDDFHPMKGPMTTQSLRGLANHGPMHWRGDRSGGSSGGDPLDELAAFEAFNVAFEGLLGRDEGELDPNQMTLFAQFALEISYPPNPIRQLNNALRADEQRGSNQFFDSGDRTDQVTHCEGCHETSRSQGFFGGGGDSTFEGLTQEFKVAHMRNLYQKVGMFGMAKFQSGTFDDSFKGDQVRGFGYLHDGSIDTVDRFVSSNVFTLSSSEEVDMEAFSHAFDSRLAPIVGQQVTLRSNSSSAVDSRVDLLIQRAGTNFVMQGAGTVTECDLIAKGVVNGEYRGWRRLSNGNFDPDRVGESQISANALRNLANTAGQEITFTCTPPGSGLRMGIDRDEDGAFDRDEIDAGTNPANGPGCGSGSLTVANSTGWASAAPILAIAAFGAFVFWRRRKLQ